MAAETGRRTRPAGMYEGGHMSDWTSFGRVDDEGTVYRSLSAVAHAVNRTNGK